MAGAAGERIDRPQQRLQRMCLAVTAWPTQDLHHDDQILSKRRLTQDARTASDASFQSSASELISPDLNARLQNIGSRIRRSVSDGYATHRFSPASVQSADKQDPINDVAIFRSSNDTLHAVYSQFPSSIRAPSDRKRVRMESTVDERDEHFDRATTVHDSNGTQNTSVITTSDLACSRPIKPLRRTPRGFGQTKSLPASVFASSSSGGENQIPLDGSSQSQEEEDWSAEAFSGDPLKRQNLA